MVLTMRQPPSAVPKPIAAWQAMITQDGITPLATCSVLSFRVAARTMKITPMVFCASFRPCPML